MNVQMLGFIDKCECLLCCNCNNIDTCRDAERVVERVKHAYEELTAIQKSPREFVEKYLNEKLAEIESVKASTSSEAESSYCDLAEKVLKLQAGCLE